MTGIRINQLPFEPDPATDDLIAIHDESTDREKKITIGSITNAVEAQVVDRIVKVRVEDEGVILNATGSSTINFVGPGVTALADEGDPNIANVNIRQKIVTNLLYVSEDGNDNLDGLTLDNAKATILSAIREGGRFFDYSDLAQAPTYPDLSSLTSGLRVQRHYNLLKDAGNSIGENKNFIVEEAWGFAALASSNPAFDNFPEKGKRDLGTILSSICADLKNGGNLSTVRAGQAFYNKSNNLDFIENILPETKTAFLFLRDLMISAMRNWVFSFVGSVSPGSNIISVNTELGSNGFLVGMVITGAPFVTPVTVTAVNRTNSTVTVSSPAPSTLNSTQFTAEYPAGGVFSSGLTRNVNSSLVPDSNHLTNNLSECSSVAHALVNYFSILESILDNGKDFVPITLPPEGFTVFVKAGVYQEDNPVEIPPHSSVIGDNLRIVTVFPNNLDKDLFHVNNGSYIAGMSFRASEGVSFPNSIVTFPTSGAGQIYESPYIQNCTNFVAGSTGLKVDGSRSLGLRSMVLDAFTQYNSGGIGCHVIEKGYTQLVSMFTICSDKSVLTETGGYVSLTNSNSDFGNFGLFSVGLSEKLLSCESFGDYDSNSFQFLIRGKDIENFPPYLGLVAQPVEPFYVVSEVRINNPGTGYLEPPEITIANPLGREGITAQVGASIVDGVVSTVEIFSEGGQYVSSQVQTEFDSRLGFDRFILNPTFVTIPSGDLDITVFVEPVLYTVKSVTRIQGLVPATYQVEFEENVPFSIFSEETFDFFQPSTIVSSSHTFEYIGGGTDILSAIPSGGAEFLPQNETITINGGRVATTSSDQGGNFRIGDGIFINNARGQIEGEDFERSIFNILSPFIIALGE